MPKSSLASIRAIKGREMLARYVGGMVSGFGCATERGLEAAYASWVRMIARGQRPGSGWRAGPTVSVDDLETASDA